jgi:hypothetical protein
VAVCGWLRQICAQVSLIILAGFGSVAKGLGDAALGEALLSSEAFGVDAQ